MFKSIILSATPVNVAKGSINLTNEDLVVDRWSQFVVQGITPVPGLKLTYLVTAQLSLRKVLLNKANTDAQKQWANKLPSRISFNFRVSEGDEYFNEVNLQYGLAMNEGVVVSNYQFDISGTHYRLPNLIADQAVEIPVSFQTVWSNYSQADVVVANGQMVSGLRVIGKASNFTEVKANTYRVAPMSGPEDHSDSAAFNEVVEENIQEAQKKSPKSPSKKAKAASSSKKAAEAPAPTPVEEPAALSDALPF